MIDIICLTLIIIGIILLILGNISIKNNKNDVIKDIKDNPNFCILIPARDESRVIENLLKSIKNQTIKVNMQDVYVIVEDIKDKTVDICKKYNVSVILRTTKRQRKGYALDEAIKQIDKYDLYFIFDADNVLDSNYLKEMFKTYNEGYDIGVGYRNCKNGNSNVISACSSLTFSMINTIGNKFRSKHNVNIIVSGTGFYIKGKYLNDGYPFHSLTEDYELSLYAILNNLTTHYNEDAIFYDEQPTQFNQTVKQRVRWIKGYFESRKKYIPLITKQLKKNTNNYGSKYSVCLGVRAYIYLVIAVVLFLIKYLYILIIGIFNNNTKLSLIINLIMFVLLIVYLILVLVTYFLLKKDKLDLNNKTKIKTILFNPIYLITYVYCALLALFKKEVKWDKIEHKDNSK